MDTITLRYRIIFSSYCVNSMNISALFGEKGSCPAQHVFFLVYVLPAAGYSLGITLLYVLYTYIYIFFFTEKFQIPDTRHKFLGKIPILDTIPFFRTICFCVLTSLHSMVPIGKWKVEIGKWVAPIGGSVRGICPGKIALGI